VEILAVSGRDFNARRCAGNMTVGEDKTVRCHDHPGAAAAARLSRCSRIAAADRKPHHGRADLVDNIDDRPRIGIQQCVVILRNGPLRGVSPAAHGIG
jgi:hypothetical protein